MGDNTNLFTLLESAINAIKKPELVQKIIALKEKVIVDSDISNLCSQILKLNDTISSLYSANEKIRCELAVVKIVNTKLEERIISLEKNLAKSEQYTRHNNIELSGIPSDISEDNPVWKLNQKTLKVSIVYQSLDTVGTLIKEL